MAHSRCAHFIAVVCLNAPSPFGQNMQPCNGLVPWPMKAEVRTYRKLTSRCTTSHELTAPAEPLSLRDERHTVAFLVNGQVTTIAEYYGVGVLAVAVVANCTLGILLLSLPCRLSVDRGCTTRSRSVGLRRFGIWFGDAFVSSVPDQTVARTDNLRFSSVMVTSKIAGLMASTSSALRCTFRASSHMSSCSSMSYSTLLT
jgi:hypothetical protein